MESWSNRLEKQKKYKLIGEPLEVDIAVESRSLTQKEERSISEYIQSEKERCIFGDFELIKDSQFSI